MKFIEVEYNEALQPLAVLLSGVKRPGDFFVSGVMDSPMPKVDISDVGTLSFPVPEDQIAAIVRQAERAPYGRGKKTVVDTSVRKVWQLAPGKVRISGKSWAANLDSILSRVSAGLGCDGVSVSAALYKLLVYDQDGFFLAHRDTEKAEGMFGTLVVTLPSAYRGGEFVIRHAGREVTVDTSVAEFSEVSYVAFYADCEHEARPVRRGSRLCLVYNLIQKRTGKSKGEVIKAPAYASQISEAAGILERFLTTPVAPAKIAWLLEHQYSPAGLSFSALKSSDAARASVLVQASARAQCAVHLAIVHIGDLGAAEPDYVPDYHGSRWNRYGDEDDEHEEDDGADDETFTAITVDDSWQYVNEWRDTGDHSVEFGPIPLGAGELLPSGALDGEKPDKQRLTEATGNEGASFERSYHRAALIIWHRTRYAEVLLQAGVVAALPYLNKLANSRAGMRKEAAALARQMVVAWAGAEKHWHPSPVRGPESSHRVEMLGLLVELGAADLLAQFITGAVIPRYEGSENAALVSSASTLGADGSATVFSALISARMSHSPSECAEFLLALTKDRVHGFREAAEAAVAGLERIGLPPRERRDAWEPEQRVAKVDPKFIKNLLDALEQSKVRTLREAAAQKIAARPEAFNPVTAVVPALELMSAGRRGHATQPDVSFLHLWTHSTEFLLHRSEFPPEPPSDWRQNVKLSCSCPDCRELQVFALNPAERVHRFRVKKERRQHLHNTIKQHALDMTHVTERLGSPQTLVCTKDRRSYDRRRKQYRKEIDAMGVLVGLAAKSEAAAALSSRMRVAVVMAGKSD